MKSVNINIIQGKVQATFAGIVSRAADNKVYLSTTELIDRQWWLIHEPVWLNANILNK